MARRAHALLSTALLQMLLSVTLLQLRASPTSAASSADLATATGFTTAGGVTAAGGVATTTNRVTTASEKKPAGNRCDMLAGRWMRTHFQPRRYTGLSCKSIDTHYNCEKNGRPNLKYLDYEWRIPGCSLKRFDPAAFLALMRNKVFMIVGDSYALNLHASFRCLIESVAVTQNFNGTLFKTGVPARGFRVPSHNATIIRIASAFLLYGEPDGERSVKSTWTVWLDRVNPEWADLLPFTDYVVMSTGYWYTSAREEKRHYYLSNSTTQLAWNPDQLITMQTALTTLITHFNRLKYRGLPMFLSFTSSHYGFELAGTEAARGAQYNCTDAWRPIGWRQVSQREWAVEDMRTRNAQVQILRKAKNFKVLDITYSTLFRPDAHLKNHNKGDGGFDCAHWCIPGVPDMWSDLIYNFVMNNKK